MNQGLSVVCDRKLWKIKIKNHNKCFLLEKMYFCAMISELQKNIIINTIMPFRPVRIGIFGSVARDENVESSDIDILYQLKESVGLLNIV